MKRILFVCLGNICRSPMAEGITNQLLQDLNLSQSFTIDSAGTASFHVGKSPDSRTIEECSKNNITLNHKARMVSSLDFEHFDYLVAMDQSNFKDLVAIAPADSKHKVLLMGDFDSVNPGADVPDPYYGTQADFEIVFEMLQRACNNFLFTLNKG